MPVAIKNAESTPKLSIKTLHFTKKNGEKIKAETIDEYLAFLHEKALNHTNYKIYSKLEHLKKSFHEQSLFLSDGSKWNDTADRSRLNPEGAHNRFAACFTFSKSENIAMWMLYGGMKREGAMIDYKKSAINDICKTAEVQLGFFDDSGTFTERKTVTDFKLELIDVLYIGEENDKGLCAVKRSDSCVYLPQNEIELLKQNKNFVHKAFPWCYENECRLVLTLPNDAPSECKNARIRWSDPEETMKQFSKRAYKTPQYIENKNNECRFPPFFQDSTLNATLEWNLCSNCKTDDKSENNCKKANNISACEESMR